METQVTTLNIAYLSLRQSAGYISKLESQLSARSDVKLWVFHSFEDLRQSEVYGKVNVLVVYFVQTADFLQVLRDNPLQWVHSYTVGVDKYLVPGFAESPVPLTNARGIYSEALAEYAFCAILYFVKKIPLLREVQAARQWYNIPSGRLAEKTLVVLGFGDIGKAVARVAKEAFSLRVFGIRKHPQPDALADSVHPLQDLHSLLPQADILVMCLPSTSELYHVVSAPELALLKPSAMLINLGRGAHVDEAALIAALTEGRLGAAALDVFETEPLPTDSPLWHCPNVLISPHNADNVVEFAQRNAKAFEDNLRLLLSGDIGKSKSLVAKEKGY